MGRGTSVPAGKVHEVIEAHQLLKDTGIVFDPAKSRGSYLHEALSGQDYFDFFTMFASSPIGYNHPCLANPEFVQYIGGLAILKPTLSDLTTTAYADFVDTFARVAAGRIFRTIFG